MCDLSILAQLELGNGLFLAAPGGDYERVWIRDNVYVAAGFEALGDWTTARRIYWGLLNIPTGINGRSTGPSGSALAVASSIFTPATTSPVSRSPTRGVSNSTTRSASSSTRLLCW